MSFMLHGSKSAVLIAASSSLALVDLAASPAMKWDSPFDPSLTLTPKVFAHVIIMCDGNRTPSPLDTLDVDAWNTKMHGTDEKLFDDTFLASFSQMKANGFFSLVDATREFDMFLDF